jgi:hypothetical protein
MGAESKGSAGREGRGVGDFTWEFLSRLRYRSESGTNHDGSRKLSGVVRYATISPCLTKHQAMKAYGGVMAPHAVLAWGIGEDERSVWPMRLCRHSRRESKLDFSVEEPKYSSLQWPSYTGSNLVVMQGLYDTSAVLTVTTTGMWGKVQRSF